MSDIKYIRFGELPQNGKSKIYKSGIETGEECGISVYNCCKMFGKYSVVLPNIITSSTLNTIKQIHVQLSSKNIYASVKVYLVTGDFVGFGTDNEPLISNAEVLEDITEQFEYPKEKKKKNPVDIRWRMDFDYYISLVNNAKDMLLSDKKEKDNFGKYYPKCDYDLTVSKSCDTFWGTEYGWNFCKKHRKGGTINLFQSIRKNYNKNLVYKYQITDNGGAFNKDKFVKDRIEKINQYMNKDENAPQ